MLRIICIDIYTELPIRSPYSTSFFYDAVKWDTCCVNIYYVSNQFPLELKNNFKSIFTVLLKVIPMAILPFILLRFHSRSSTI